MWSLVFEKLNPAAQKGDNHKYNCINSDFITTLLAPCETLMKRDLQGSLMLTPSMVSSIFYIERFPLSGSTICTLISSLWVWQFQHMKCHMFCVFVPSPALLVTSKLIVQILSRYLPLITAVHLLMVKPGRCWFCGVKSPICSLQRGFTQQPPQWKCLNFTVNALKC